MGLDQHRGDVRDVGPALLIAGPLRQFRDSRAGIIGIDRLEIVGAEVALPQEASSAGRNFSVSQRAMAGERVSKPCQPLYSKVMSYW